MQVGTGTWSQVTSGGEHNLAIQANVTLWAWGTTLTANSATAKISAAFYQNGDESWTGVPAQTFTVEVTAGAPEIAVSGGGVDIRHHDATPSPG